MILDFDISAWETRVLSQPYTIEQLATRKKVIAVVAEVMTWPQEKATLWYRAKNPLLGNVSPECMVKAGRAEKLFKFIQNCIEGNFA